MELLFILSLMTVTGFNFTLWIFIGLLRVLTEKISSLFQKKTILYKFDKYTIDDVAAIIPAHNEEVSLPRTLAALLQVFPKEQIYVASDYSTDQTIAICQSLGVNVIDINPNLGKARALKYAIEKFKLTERYKLVMISDADIEIDKNYLNNALPYFNDPEIVALAGHGVPRIERYNFWQAFYIAYRIRIWRSLQYGMRYGQTWKFTNVNFIIPGAFSMYRSDVLKQLQIDAPGLMIEDFNMTFEVQKKKLGKIAYSPKAFQTHQDPYNLRDYVKQIQRWDIGFFQTVKRHGFWPSIFWLATTSYTLEVYFYALLLVITPSFLISFFLNGFQPIDLQFTYITLFDLVVGIFVMDYFLTIITAYFEKKPMMLVYGLGFIFLRYVDSLVYVGSPFVAMFKKSTGTWKSPKRL